MLNVAKKDGKSFPRSSVIRTSFRILALNIIFWAKQAQKPWHEWAPSAWKDLWHIPRAQQSDGLALVHVELQVSILSAFSSQLIYPKPFSGYKWAFDFQQNEAEININGTWKKFLNGRFNGLFPLQLCCCGQREIPLVLQERVGRNPPSSPRSSLQGAEPTALAQDRALC